MSHKLFILKNKFRSYYIVLKVCKFYMKRMLFCSLSTESSQHYGYHVALLKGTVEGLDVHVSDCWNTFIKNIWQQRLATNSDLDYSHHCQLWPQQVNLVPIIITSSADVSIRFITFSQIYTASENVEEPVLSSSKHLFYNVAGRQYR